MQLYSTPLLKRTYEALVFKLTSSRDNDFSYHTPKSLQYIDSELAACQEMIDVIENKIRSRI